MFLFYSLICLLTLGRVNILVHSLNAVAFECGKPAIYLSEGTWVIDTIQHCLEDEVSIINYCKIIYHNENITKSVIAPSITISLPNWCRFDDKYCNRHVIITHKIRPFICLDNIPSSIISIPDGCQIGTQIGMCESIKYWQYVSVNFCNIRKMRLSNLIPTNPCIKEGFYFHLHFSAVQILCCNLPVINYSEAISDVSDVGKSDFSSNTIFHPSIDYDLATSKLENYEKTFEKYLSHPSERNKNGILIPEHVRYNDAKLAFSSATLKREENLEKQLADAESIISPVDWQIDPIHSQLSEDNLLKEFRKKFVNLENESEQKRKTLELVHQQRLENQMFERRKMVLTAWHNTVNSMNPRNDTLFRELQRLIQIVEHDRLHFIKRYEHLRMTDSIEASAELPIIKTNLIELDLLLNASLEKLDMHPKYKSDLLTYVHHMRSTKYNAIEAAVKSILVATVDLTDLSPLPTNKEQSSMKAESILAKYRHHLDSLAASSAIDKIVPIRSEDTRYHNTNNNGADKYADVSAFHQFHRPTTHTRYQHPGLNLKRVSENNQYNEFQTTTTPIWKTVPISETQNSAHTKLMNDTKQQSATTSIPPITTTLTDGDSSRFVIEEFGYNNTITLLPHSIMVDNSTATSQQLHPAQRGKFNTATVLLCASFAAILLGITAFYLIRWYTTRVHPNQKGYTLTVVEVDEVTRSKDNSLEPSPPFGPIRRNRKQRLHNYTDEDDAIRNWQMNGYENPAYKYGNESNNNHCNQRKLLI